MATTLILSFKRDSNFINNIRFFEYQFLFTGSTDLDSDTNELSVEQTINKQPVPVAKMMTKRVWSKL